LRTLTEITIDYEVTHAARAERELRFFAIQKSLSRAVSLAGLAVGPGGKRFSHQFRIPAEVLKESEKRLQSAISELRSATTFESLHEIVRRRIGNIRGIGELAVYDTALRIGAYLSLSPTSVFLHAGTRDGARALGFDAGTTMLQVNSLPTALRKFQPHQIEDILCIYKDQLAAATKSR
jgi:hypothetical protein